MHPRWKGGKTITAKGYVRFTVKHLRNKYEHRVVMERMCREFCYYGLEGIPEGFDVHHLDFRTTHNCPCNLLLLESRIHKALENGRDMECKFSKEYLDELTNEEGA